MQILIPLEGRVHMIIRSSFIAAKRQTETQYSLTGDSFQMSCVTAQQIVILPDTVQVTEGDVLTHEILMQALPIETFVQVSAEEALPNLLGLLLRSAVADGKLTDAELLSVQPALEGRLWQPGISVQIGDVYSFCGCLWRCIQAHTTQGDWAPDMVPSLWHRVEIIHEGAVRVWSAGISYAIGDVLAYPDKHSPQYECLQAHTSQTGWEPPNTPALWTPRAHALEKQLPLTEVESEA